MNRLGKLFVGIALENWLRYLAAAGLAWLLAYVFFRKKWWHRKIIQRDPGAANVRRELGWSVLTVLVYGLVGTVTVLLGRGGSWRIYRDIDSRGWLWFGLSVLVAIVVHDTWFYWTHRLMHHRRLFRWFHRVHHESSNPSPWAAYAFSPLEAAVQAGIFPLLAFTVPMHPLAFLIFMVWQIGNNVLGHTGFEFYPRWLMDTWLGRIINTPTHHVQHHEKMRGNYGLYFNVWDRLMGTNHPGYEAKFREVTGRSAGAQARMGEMTEP